MAGFVAEYGAIILKAVGETLVMVVLSTGFGYLLGIPLGVVAYITDHGSISENRVVNTVVGFIGPEYLYDSRQVIRAGLEDHFMGKLSGIPMGCDCCYTNHMLAEQNDIENLAMLLGAAGANYILGVPTSDDVMLNYQTNAYHDVAAIREVLGLRPIREFDQWLEKMGISENGRLTSRAGDPTIFLQRGGRG